MERSILPPDWQVPSEFHQRLGATVGRQRPMLADGHLLLVLHRPPKPDEIEREGRYFWRQPDSTWRSSHHGGGAAAVSRHLGEYAELLQKFDQLEQSATSAPEYFAVIDNVAPLLRAARNMHHVLQEARRLVPEDRDLLNLRDRAYEVERTGELLYADAKNALEFLAARRAEQNAITGRRMEIAAHRLNMLAAFFLPIATVCAILEVDPDGAARHLREPTTLLALVGIGLVAGSFFTALVLARRGGEAP